MYFGNDKVGVQEMLHGAWGEGEGKGGLRKAQDGKAEAHGKDAVTT